MFHLADLRAVAKAPAWVPPGTEPIPALLKRARSRKWSTGIQGIADVWFADELDALDELADQLTSVCGTDPVRLAAAGAAILEPHRVLPGPFDATTRERDYHLVAAAKSPVESLLTVVTVRQRSGKKPRQRRMVDFAVQQYDLNHDVTVCTALESLHRCVEQPDAFILPRGRSAAPVALWLGAPNRVQLPSDWLAQLRAVAATRGYRVRALTEPSLLKDVPNEVARANPELLLFLEAGLSSVRTHELATARAPRAAIARLDGVTWDTILDQARHELRDADVRSIASLKKPASVGAAVDIALGEGLPDCVVVLKRGRKSARDSPYKRPQDALDGLRAIARVAPTWVDGLGCDLQTAFLAEGMDYAPFVSATARQEHSQDYTITWHGSQVLMGPHLRWGGKGDETCLRIYWHADQQRKVIVIGHIGRHLRGAD